MIFYYLGRIMINFNKDYIRGLDYYKRGLDIYESSNNYFNSVKTL